MTALIVALVLLGAASAYAATTAKHYKGKTSQHEPISFTISAGQIKNLSFFIDVRCPSGHRYRVYDSHFPSFKITRARFDQSFFASNPKATARVEGRVRAKSVTGTLTDRTMIKREHHYCGGKSTFKLLK
ncbi:MAG: hypothetical protein JOZ98_17505 [Solirubrobacterales bacterium]|nr:hypothetical protein [Solirubrobacterales bacterium]MBV9797850.1 hypothetical protein [Solirubrobacterales bacterium]